MNIYESKGSNTPESLHFETNSNLEDIPKITNKNNIDFDSLFTCRIRNALKMINDGKNPGCDGLQSEFYNLFWPDIGQILTNTLNYTHCNGI